MENKKNMRDFLSSIVTFLLSIYVLFESRNIYIKAGKVMYLSPALIPTMLGAMMLVLAILLFVSSIKDGGPSARVGEFSAYMKDVKADPNSLRMLIGLAFMGIYTFVLLGLFPFWLATFLFMFLLMFFLEAGDIIHIVIISAVITALVVFLFQVCFRVPLP